MKEIEELISAVGFPIASCVAMGIFIYKIHSKMSNTLDKVTERTCELKIRNIKAILIDLNRSFFIAFINFKEGEDNV